MKNKLRSQFSFKGNLFVAVILAASFVGYSQQARAWGNRGHHAICESAVYLVKDPVLRQFLLSRTHVMGYLCNIPDTHWKGMNPDLTKHGNPSHFVDTDLFDRPLSEVPTDYREVVKLFTGYQAKVAEKPIQWVPAEIGSIWWRADQFWRRMVEFATLAKSQPLPANRIEDRDEKFPFNSSVHQMVINMGLMGHFVGDVTMPLHNSLDYDGYKSGHGGLHSFYEEICVSEMAPNIVPRILTRAKEQKTMKFNQQATLFLAMRELSELGRKDIPLMVKADKILKPSELKTDKGMQIKTPAERPSAAIAFKSFEKLILSQMGRSALTLAKAWDAAFEKAGKPDLSKYKSFAYPHAPDFIMPDYYSN